jgi:hypothetical protein
LGVPGAEAIMRTIYQAENVIDANLVKGALEHAGIPAFVAGEYLTGAAGQLPMIGLVAVMVADSDVAAADPIVRGIDTALRETAQTDREDGDSLASDFV